MSDSVTQPFLAGVQRKSDDGLPMGFQRSQNKRVPDSRVVITGHLLGTRYEYADDTKGKSECWRRSTAPQVTQHKPNRVAARFGPTAAHVTNTSLESLSWTKFDLIAFYDSIESEWDDEEPMDLATCKKTNIYSVDDVGNWTATYLSIVNCIQTRSIQAKIVDDINSQWKGMETKIEWSTPRRFTLRDPRKGSLRRGAIDRIRGNMRLSKFTRDALERMKKKMMQQGWRDFRTWRTLNPSSRMHAASVAVASLPTSPFSSLPSSQQYITHNQGTGIVLERRLLPKFSNMEERIAYKSGAIPKDTVEKYLVAFSPNGEQAWVEAAHCTPFDNDLADDLMTSTNMHGKMLEDLPISSGVNCLYSAIAAVVRHSGNAALIRCVNECLYPGVANSLGMGILANEIIVGKTLRNAISAKIDPIQNPNNWWKFCAPPPWISVNEDGANFVPLNASAAPANKRASFAKWLKDMDDIQSYLRYYFLFFFFSHSNITTFDCFSILVGTDFQPFFILILKFLFFNFYFSFLDQAVLSSPGRLMLHLLFVSSQKYAHHYLLVCTMATCIAWAKRIRHSWVNGLTQTSYVTSIIAND